MKKLVVCLIWLVTAAVIARVFNIYQADIFFARGVAFQRLGRSEESYQQLKQAAVLNPREPSYFKKLAQVTTTLAQEKDNRKQLQEADVYAQKAFYLNPNNLLTLKSLTLTYLKAAQLSPIFLEKAEAVAQLAIGLCPTDPQLHYNLAVTYWSEEKHPEALEAVNQALELKSDYEEAQTLRKLLQATVTIAGTKAPSDWTGAPRPERGEDVTPPHSLQAQSFSRK